MESSGSANSSQCLTFRLDHELFAINIAKVQEVLEFSTVTKVPRTPDFMRGVINLRGNVVPVVDLRIKLGLSPTERTVDTCIVITEVTVGGDNVIVGALVDSVQEVLELGDGDISPPPRMGARIDANVISGMGRRNDEFVMILDIDKVFPPSDLKAVAAM
jgi:purine-binding chemotaxis protein CheW